MNSVKEDRITVKGLKTGSVQNRMLNDEPMQCLTGIKALPCKVGSIYLPPNQKGQYQFNERKKPEGLRALGVDG